MLLDPCSTDSYMSQNLIRNLRSRKLQVHTMSVDSLNGSFTQKCTQIEVYLPGTNGSIKVYEKRINISIDSTSNIIDAIRENEKYFMNEILAINISYEVLNSKYIKNIELDGHKICLGVDLSR